MSRAVLHRILVLVLSFGLLSSLPDRANAFRFNSIDGGTIDLASMRGRPILVVNTASRCGFTGQYDGLQALYDRYRARGLVVIAVPSQDFGQELATDAQVAQFCAVSFDLDLPMTTLTPVRGAQAHPFYRWLATSAGYAPRWNFEKVLIDPRGAVAGTWRSNVDPQSTRITREIEAMLP